MLRIDYYNREESNTLHHIRRNRDLWTTNARNIKCLVVHEPYTITQQNLNRFPNVEEFVGNIDNIKNFGGIKRAGIFIRYRYPALMKTHHFEQLTIEDNIRLSFIYAETLVSPYKKSVLHGTFINYFKMEIKGDNFLRLHNEYHGKIRPDITVLELVNFASIDCSKFPNVEIVKMFGGYRTEFPFADRVYYNKCMGQINQYGHQFIK